MATRQEAIAIIQSRTGLGADPAGVLVDAFLAAAQQEALDLIAGDAPVPSALADARALRLRYIVSNLNRPVTRREVEVLFRLTPIGASSVIGRMNATYATLGEKLLRTLVLEIVNDEKNAKLEGSANAGWRCVITFDERAQVDYVLAVFERNANGRAILRTSARSIEVAAEIDGQNTLELLRKWLSP